MGRSLLQEAGAEGSSGQGGKCAVWGTQGKPAACHGAGLYSEGNKPPFSGKWKVILSDFSIFLRVLPGGWPWNGAVWKRQGDSN